MTVVTAYVITAVWFTHGVVPPSVGILAISIMLKADVGMVIFWGIREPRLVGMGWGFLLGLAMDVADASVLGQHALAYVLVAYGATTLSRRVLWFPLLQQALHVLPLLLLAQLVQLCVRAMPGLAFPGWSYFAGPFVGAALWLPLTFLLLLPQHQPVDRDANRPI